MRGGLLGRVGKGGGCGGMDVGPVGKGDGLWGWGVGVDVDVGKRWMGCGDGGCGGERG